MTDHYFADTPGSEFVPREIEVSLGGETRRVLTASGVFSGEHLDHGTAVLLRALLEAETLRGGRILDLGCGWGPIALDAALSAPGSEVWAVDVNSRARRLTQLNADRLGLVNVRAAAPDEVPEELSFAQIRSNPPIRVGKKALHEMLRLWLPRLESEGSAFLVVAKHLGAESLLKWIATEFEYLRVDRMYRDRGFHVIRATRTPSQA